MRKIYSSPLHRVRGVFSAFVILTTPILFAQQIEADLLSDTLSQVVIESPMIQKSVMKLPTSYQLARISSTISRAGNSPIPALNTISGVYVQSGALNTNRITIRGVGSRNPFGTNRIKAYFAGIPLTGGDGETELDDISSEIVSSIEVFKGGKSAFYGAGLGGVILLNPANIVPTGWNFSFSTDLGSDGLKRFGATASIGSSSSESFLGISNYSFDGWRENSKYDRISLLFVHDQKIGKHRLQVLLTGQTVQAEIPSSLNEEDFINNPSSAAFTWNSVNGREDNYKLLLGFNGTLNYTENLKQQLILFSSYYNGKEFRPFNDLDDDNHRLGFRTILGYERNRVSLQVSSEAFLERYQWSTFIPGTDTLLNKFEEERKPLNIGVQLGVQLNDRWYAEAGVSANFLSYLVTDVQAGSASEQFAYDNILSPFIGISYAISDYLTFFGSIGHGFSYPSLQETLLPEGVKNPNLKPEKGLTEELGIRYTSQSNRLAINASAFLMQLDELLVTERIENGDGFGVNAGSAKNSGIELNIVASLWESEKAWLKKVTLTGNTTIASYAFDHFIDDENDYSDNKLPGLPSVINHSSLSVNASDHWRFQIDHHFYGNQYLDDANTAKLRRFNVWNSKLKYLLDRKSNTIQMSMGVNNIFDLNYAGMVVVNAPSFGGNSPRYFYPGQPRNFTFGLKVSF